MSGFSDAMIAYIGKELASNGYKFRKGESDFYRKTKDGTFSVFLDFLKASDGQHFTLNVICRFRINLIEEVYTKYHPYLSSAEKKKHFTVYAKYGNKPLFKNTLSDPFLPEDAIVKADGFLKCFYDEIEPFFARYSSLDGLVDNLASEDYKVWITSDPICRYSVLMSSAAIKKNREDFETCSQQLLKHCEQPFAQANLPLAKALVDGIWSDFF